jgi:hypothetical protein
LRRPLHNASKKDTQRCVQEIAIQLGLPISISLTYVPKDFSPGNVAGFRSSELSRTDWTGHGVDGIIAQVSIPESLPLYGSSSLSGYPIGVRVNENGSERPETFVAIMAHELSHVLLRSLRHPGRASELHTDLVPILLGFGDCVRKGRKNVQRKTSGGVTTTNTTTYGYLTDSQFEFAWNKVRSMLQYHQGRKKHLLTLIAQANRKLHKTAQLLASFREYLVYLDTRLTGRMREDDARRVVRFHTWDFTRDWESTIAQARRRLEESAVFANPLRHYTSRAIGQLQERTLGLDQTYELLEQLTAAITVDVKILRRYVSLTYRLRRVIMRPTGTSIP